MTYDLLIKNGLLVDGTGAPARRADVAITGGTITEIGHVTGGATRVIDAAGIGSWSSWAASVRVWQIMSRGRGPRGGRAVPEGANVAYAPGQYFFLSASRLLSILRWNSWFTS